jgi:PadR family transcriptional regulator, regulatory protein AphA
MELNATAKVLLGFIAARPRSGYEIKQLVDLSTRFFWAASYGRIYPALKRLEEEGLITGADASQGARSRTVYKLTAKGRKVAEEWISSPPEVYELRDEGLLKLFFAETLNPERASAIASERGARSAAVAAQLRGVKESVAAANAETPEHTDDAGSDAVLEFGIALNQFVADWFERKALELSKTKENA